MPFLRLLILFLILSVLKQVYMYKHHQTPMTCTYVCRHFIHFKTVATEVEILFLSTLMSLLAQFGSAFFSSKEGGPVLLSI